MLTVGSLFAGIGGFDLGFERAGFEIKWQVEIDPFCRAVLAKHWPQVRRYEDVRDVGAEIERVDVICGGFPCQDISVAGAGAGINGPRSGLWREFARLVGQLRPRYVVVENVAALLDRGIERVVGDLAALGFDAEWQVVPLAAFGAPHLRERVWILAYPASDRLEGDVRETQAQAILNAPPETLATWHQTSDVFRDWPQLLAETGFRGVADEFPNRSHRLRAIGNSVSPIAAEWIAHRIKEAEGLAA